MMSGYGAGNNNFFTGIIRSITILLACGALFATFCAADWHDAVRSLPEKAEQAYKQKDYKKALQLYQEAQTRNPDSDTLAYNLGNTLYQLGKYQDAAKQYGKILEKDSAAIAPQAIYNMGNSLFKMGRESQNQEFLQQALEAYKHSIISDPKDEDSKYNYELTRRLIKEQEQQQQQQNKDKQDKNKDKNQNQKQAQNQNDKNQQEKQQQQAQKEKEKKQQQPRQSSGQQQAEQEKKKEEQQPKPGEMSKQEADKILQALIQMEKEAREQQNKKKQPAAAAKGPDW